MTGNNGNADQNGKRVLWVGTYFKEQIEKQAPVWDYIPAQTARLVMPNNDPSQNIYEVSGEGYSAPTNRYLQADIEEYFQILVRREDGTPHIIAENGAERCKGILIEQDGLSFHFQSMQTWEPNAGSLLIETDPQYHKFRGIPSKERHEWFQISDSFQLASQPVVKPQQTGVTARENDIMRTQEPKRGLFTPVRAVVAFVGAILRRQSGPAL